MTKYVKWRKPRHIQKENGDNRTCMHCGKLAVHTAVLRTGRFFRMDVWFCDNHMKAIKEVSE